MAMENRPSPAVQTCYDCKKKYMLFDGDPPHKCPSPVDSSTRNVQAEEAALKKLKAARRNHGGFGGSIWQND